MGDGRPSTLPEPAPGRRDSQGIDSRKPMNPRRKADSYAGFGGRGKMGQPVPPLVAGGSKANRKNRLD